MIARPEHPKPQFMREAWRNLNGKWDFCFDESNSGLTAGVIYLSMRHYREI